MACSLHPTPPPEPAEAQDAVPPAMTRCECAGVAFAEVKARIWAGESLEDASKRSGCGRTCTACLPDLHLYLARLT